MAADHCNDRTAALAIYAYSTELELFNKPARQPGKCQPECAKWIREARISIAAPAPPSASLVAQLSSDCRENPRSYRNENALQWSAALAQRPP